jgi:hypothetical protein
VSRKTVTIGKEVFDFLAWKKPGHSFYGRRSDGELRVVALIGSGRPLWATPFRCEVDGITIGFNAYQLLPLSLSEWLQLQNIEPPEARKSEPPKQGKISPEVSAKRSAAAKARATVALDGDRAKIRSAFSALVAAGQPKANAARIVAKQVNASHNPLRLEGVPYKTKVTDRMVMRIAAAKR